MLVGRLLSQEWTFRYWDTGYRLSVSVSHTEWRHKSVTFASVVVCRHVRRQYSLSPLVRYTCDLRSTEFFFPGHPPGTTLPQAVLCTEGEGPAEPPNVSWVCRLEGTSRSRLNSRGCRIRCSVKPVDTSFPEKL